MEYISFYSVYLGNFYQRFPHLYNAPYRAQMDGLLSDGFYGGHMFASVMGPYGYEADFAVVDCYTSQCIWALENEFVADRTQLMEIACKQIDKMKPEVLFLADPCAFDPKILSNCIWKPKLVIAWRAASIPDNADWSAIDLMISSLEGCRDKALKLGARAVEYFKPGFPNFVAEVVKDEQKKWDVVFAGQVSICHTERAEFLNQLSAMPEFYSREKSLRCFLFNPTFVPLSVADCHIQPAVWGMDMFRTLKQARIVVNSHIDMALGQSQNMRVYEATGIGSFLITEQSDSLREMFEPGVEIETYNSQGELEEKIRYYLEHPEEREAIAKRGQERCLRDHSLEVRAKELDRLIKLYMPS